MVENKVFLLHAILSGVFCVSGFDCGSQDGKLQVHLVPHSHDDVGWLKTVDEYYYGANRTIQNAAVQYTLDTMVMSLQKDTQRTFIQVEMAFFKRWWDEQDKKTKKVVKKLVKNKQLEFINAGWSMNDEAATHYNALIDQMSIGLRFVNETFGPDARPTVAWHIDPFGHSAEQASLFSLMSFDAFFLGRIDHADKDKRLKEHRMEMVWRGSRNFGKASEIFTGVLYNNYSPPPGFCFDEMCEDAPIQDDPRLFDMNVQERVDAFVTVTCKQAKHFKTNHIILTMGEDFMYQNAHRWYKNLDKLIRYVNKDGRVHAFYSTPSRYLKALHDADKEWGVKSDDFFPYSHCNHCYWTGYFTSRPALKAYIRESNNILQTCKQVEVIQRKVKTRSSSSNFLRRAMAVNQHHDAVTGTEKQHVANDYAKRLHMGRTQCQDVISSFINQRIDKYHQQASSIDFRRCDYLNISVCKITERERSVVINVYNPIARPVSTYVKIPVNDKKLVVLGSNGEPLESQIAHVSRYTRQLRNFAKGSAAYELTFEVCAPPLGFSTYFLNRTSREMRKHAAIPSQKKRLTADNDYIENQHLRLEFSAETGRLVRMTRKDGESKTHSVNVDQQFYWYEGSQGDKESKQTSGAYIFRPESNTPKPISKSGKVKSTILKGRLFSEVRQVFGPFVSQVIRLYKDSPFAEFEYTIGPIPVDDNIGKEIITRFDTSIESGGTFYTDANGREIKERKRDFRETWKLNTTSEPVSQNYYPVNSRIFIKDSTTQLTVMTDRSQGGSSIKDGQIELMLHRRLLLDDFLGVGEALNETGVSGRGLVTRGKHRVLLSAPSVAARLHRQQGELMLMEPIISFSENRYTLEEWKGKFVRIYSGLSRPLPENVHLLTLETTGRKNEIILRLEHFLEKDEDAVLSKAVTVNLDGLFTDFNVVSITELNLSANQFLKDKRMLKWNTKNTSQFNTKPKQDDLIDGLKLVLNPMEIRTFLVNIHY